MFYLPKQYYFLNVGLVVLYRCMTLDSNQKTTFIMARATAKLYSGILGKMCESVREK